MKSQDIEALTQRILLIGKGHILLDGSLEELRRRYAGEKTLTVSYSGEALPVLTGLSGVSVASDLPGRATLRIEAGGPNVSEIITRLSALVPIKDLAVADESLEEMMVSLYREYRI